MFRHHRPATASDRHGLSSTGTPLIRTGFPVFDRHHHHRYPVWGYQGAMNVLVWILDKIFDERPESRREPLCRF
jgi:nitrogenase molybdenum-iron protein alpha/beta subunit